MLTIAQEEGVRFKEFLKKIEVKAIKMAEILNVQRGTVSKYIQGDVRIPSDTVVFLRKEYGLSFEFFYCGVRPIIVKDVKDKNLVTSTEELKMQLTLIANRLESYTSITDKLVKEVYSKASKS